MEKKTDKFEDWRVPELRRFLAEREVPVFNQSKDVLVRNCYAAVMLSLKPKLSEEKHLSECSDSKLEKLVMDGGMINLPDPDNLTTGWEDSPDSLPDLMQDSVEQYLHKLENEAIGIKTSGEESLHDGKSLHLAGLVQCVQYHGVGENIPYCFVRCNIVRDTNLSDTPYRCWIIVHKKKCHIVESYCNCPTGLRGACKHVSALCHHTIKRGAHGEHRTEFMENIHIQNVQGNFSIKEEEEATRLNCFQSDPRAPQDRQPRTIYDLDIEGLRKASKGKAGILCYLPAK